jgi:MATE family multidrug resistance protein
MFSGVIKAVGAQLYGAIMTFIGFYLIGLPIGLTLMLRTHLKVYGFWIGILCGISILSLMQIVYTLRINWKKEASKVKKDSSQFQYIFLNSMFIF